MITQVSSNLHILQLNSFGNSSLIIIFGIHRLVPTMAAFDIYVGDNQSASDKK